MNSRWKLNPELLPIMAGGLLLVFLLVVAFALGFIRPSASALELFTRANSTRTAIALTSQSILGPFPTATGPSPTASNTPSITPTVTATPTGTPSPTPVRYFIDTGTPRTLVPGSALTTAASTPVPTKTPARPTSTSVPPTNPPRQPTNPPQQPTNPPQQPTNPPKQPTNPPPATKQPKPTKTPKPPKPPHPSKTPKKYTPVLECVSPSGCSYFVSEKAFYGAPRWPDPSW